MTFTSNGNVETFYFDLISQFPVALALGQGVNDGRLRMEYNIYIFLKFAEIRGDRGGLTDARGGLIFCNVRKIKASTVL